MMTDDAFAVTVPSTTKPTSTGRRRRQQHCMRRMFVLLLVVTTTRSPLACAFVSPFSSSTISHNRYYDNGVTAIASSSSTTTSCSSRLFATVITNNSTIGTTTVPMELRKIKFTGPKRRVAAPSTQLLVEGEKTQTQRKWSNNHPPRELESSTSTKSAVSVAAPRTTAETETSQGDRQPTATVMTTTTIVVNEKTNHHAPQQHHQQKKKAKGTAKEEEFRWLNWVYCQWKDTKPGQLTDEAVLRQMTVAISKWAKRKSLYAAERAEELLERLITEAEAGNPHLIPMSKVAAAGLQSLHNNNSNNNSSTSSSSSSSSSSQLLTVSEFNKAMDAYGKVGQPEGVQRILRRMELLQKNGSHGDTTAFAHLRPDAFSMSILATAWAKSRSPDASQKAEAILQYMDLNGLVPNTITYNAVLNAVAVGTQIDKALKAEDIVQQMKEQHEKKGLPCEPDVYTYQSLIQAWSKTTLPGSPQKAEQILRFLDIASETNPKLMPNAYCFTTVIHCWARSSERSRARSAYNLLNVLTKRSQDVANSPKTAKQLKPNVKTFTAVLNACARPSDEIEALDAYAIAKLTMAELSLGVYGRPNFLSFAAFLSVCATTLDAGSKRDSVVRRTFGQAKSAGEVGTIVLEKLHAAASLELVTELIGEYRDASGEIQVPRQWKANVKGEKASSFFLPTPKVTEEVVSTVSKSSQKRFGAVQRRFEGQFGTMSGEIDEEIMWRNGSF